MFGWEGCDGRRMVNRTVGARRGGEVAFFGAWSDVIF